MANGSENLFNRQKKPGTQPSSDSRIGTSIDNHRSYTSARSESDEDCQHQPDEFGILRDTAGRVRAPNGRLLRAFERDIAGIIAITHGSMQQFRQQQAITQPSIDTTVSPLIDGNHIYGTRACDQNIKRNLCWKTPDDYGTHRNEHGYAQAASGRCRDNTSEIFTRAKSTSDPTDYGDICKHSRLESEHYNKYEINEMLTCIHGAQHMSVEAYNKMLDDIYYPLNNNINWLTTRNEEMQKELDMIHRKNALQSEISTSIDRKSQPLIDARLTSLEDLLKSFDYKLYGVYYPLSK